MNYYQLLGVDAGADAATIKNAFRKLAKKYHPDTNPGDKEAELKFKDINEAYAILSDDTKRAKYDAELKGAATGSRTTSQGGGMNQQSARQKNPNMGKAPNMADFYESFRNSFDNLMGQDMKMNEEKNQKKAGAQPDFMNVNQQFASFFGFKPR